MEFRSLTECFEAVALHAVIGECAVVDTHEEEVSEVQEEGEEEEAERHVVQLLLFEHD